MNIIFVYIKYIYIFAAILPIKFAIRMTNKITCPNCGHQFDAEQALASRIETAFKDEYEKKIREHKEKFHEEKQKIEIEKRMLLEQQEQQAELVKDAVAKELETERIKIQKTTLETYEEKLRKLQDENQKSKAENKELKVKELQLMEQKQKLDDEREELELKVKRQLLEGQKKIEDKARAKERESFELEKIKLLKQIDDNKKLAEEMKRKAEQGSMELQGEVQEIALEDLLRNSYPFDKVEAVPKGVRGADCIQTVVNLKQQNCGTIVYESKRTQSFSNLWISKLKQDQTNCKADLAVIVTEAMPGDMERFGEKDGVWICGFHEVRSLSFVLREMLIKMQTLKVSQENKGDKMELLYNYLTSNEFVQNIKLIVENYEEMINQLNKEKKAIMKIWAMREKQIWAVQENVSALFGSIKGIAGKELKSAEVMQLPGAEISDE